MTSTKNSLQSLELPTRLCLEAAVVSRLLRSGNLPAPLFPYFAGIVGAKPCQGDGIDGLCDARLAAIINEIIQPVQADASQTEQRKTQHSAQWLAAACRCAAEHYTQLQLGIGPRLLAASLLPLYRCLATGNLSEGLRQCQTRLAELLCLLALCHEVGGELVEVLDGRNRRMDSPDSILSTQFNLNLACVAELLCELASDFDPVGQQFGAASVERLQRFDPKQPQTVIPQWATPSLLWKLSGELISKNSELVLPRSWIDTPVPWNSVADHWQKLSFQLSGQPNAQPPMVAVGGVVDNDQADRNSAVASTSALGRMTPGMAAMSSKTQPPLPSPTETPISLDCLPVEEVGDAENTLATIEAISALIKSNETTSVDPKVIIAEIHSHNDPIFVNVIRRQIGKCRADDRAVSLVSMVVLPEDEKVQHPIHENGLKRWQQKLVNWLAEHPQVIEPHAFLTTDGELLLCLLDLERNETTALVRHGLVEVLTGQHVDAGRGSVLAKVNVPARYHAGIASTSSPGAGFSPEQLIEPAIRCLSAASAHGKASIKSIEVY